MLANPFWGAENCDVSKRSKEEGLQCALQPKEPQHRCILLGFIGEFVFFKAVLKNQKRNKIKTRTPKKKQLGQTPKKASSVSSSGFLMRSTWEILKSQSSRTR